MLYSYKDWVVLKFQYNIDINYFQANFAELLPLINIYNFQILSCHLLVVHRILN